MIYRGDLLVIRACRYRIKLIINLMIVVLLCVDVCMLHFREEKVPIGCRRARRLPAASLPVLVAHDRNACRPHETIDITTAGGNEVVIYLRLRSAPSSLQVTTNQPVEVHTCA